MFIYLDHNIIQYDYENILYLKKHEDICYVYSEEHFNEINRMEDDRYFEVLRRIQARKLKLKLDSGFHITNEAIVLDYKDPKEFCEEYLKTIEEFKTQPNIFLSLQPFFAGNKEAIDPTCIKKQLVNQIQALGNDIFTEEMNNGKIKNLFDQYNTYSNILGDCLEKVLKDAQEKILPIEKQRKAINAVDLSSLNPANGMIIDQIWTKVKDYFPGISKDQLFGRESLPFSNIETVPLFLSVVQCHTILNYLGYWPDKGIAKVSKMYGINSDSSHLAHSVFCSGIISADDRLCKKANAIYQYLVPGKVVIQIKLNNSIDS